MTELNLEIITPSKSVFAGVVNSVTLPGTLGSFQVLRNHAPIISTFEIGLVKIEIDMKNLVHYATAGGTIEVLENKVLILADSLELAKDIDIDRAKRAAERAQNRLSKKDTDNIDTARAKAALARALNRISVAKKYR